MMIALRFMFVMSVLTGVLYPVLVTGVGNVFFRDQAQGSLIKDGNGRNLGSVLIAQKFDQPNHFWARPSSIDYKAEASSGSNLGPLSLTLKEQVQQRFAQGLRFEMLFASGSGLDPHISPEAALSQIPRIVAAGTVTPDDLVKLIDEHTEGRQFGVLGEPRVNVLKLNLALDER